MRTYALTLTTALFIFGAAPFAQAAELAPASRDLDVEHISTGRSVAQSSKKCFKLSEACLYDEVNQEGLRDCQRYLEMCELE